MAYKRLLSDVYYKSKFTGKEIDRRLTDVDDKQDIITDLDEIRAGAAKGETAYQLPEGGIPDTDLSQGVNASLDKADTAVQDPNYVHTDNNYTDADKTDVAKIGGIEALIPPQASDDNQLADKDFVNSSVATNTANFIGTFNSVQELEDYSGTLTNNDYAFVIGTDAQGNTQYDRYKYVAESEQWLYEYTLNNSSFTAEQWAAINSGMTASLVSKLSALPTNDELTTALNGKQNVISDLDTIRAGASAGATAVQGVKVNGVALTPDANKVVNIEGVEVASAVTESFLSRASRGKVQATISQLQGNTIVFNQLYNLSPNLTYNVTASSPLGNIISNVNANFTVAGHKYYVNVSGAKTSGTNQLYFPGRLASAAFEIGVPRIVEEGSTPSTNAGLYLYNATIGENAGTISVNIFDLTLMFGAGNEPTTVDAFKAMFPLPYYAYNSGQIINVAPTAIKSVGDNIWDEQWSNGRWNNDADGNMYIMNTGSWLNYIYGTNYINVLPNTQYYLHSDSSPIYGYYLDINHKCIDKGLIQRNSIFTTPNNCYYFVFWTYSEGYDTYKFDICINRSDPAKNGTYAPYIEEVTPLPITTMTSGGTAVYPLGLAKVGNLTDSLIADSDGWIRKARVQFGSRAYQAGDESDPTVLTDGTTTIYPLTTPQELTLDTPICLNYPQLGGTEWVLGTTLPLPATTLYDAPIGKASKADLQVCDNGLVALADALATQLGVTIERSWDSTNGKWVWTIS